MIGTDQQDAFLSRSGRAIAVVRRPDGTPAASMVTFGRDGDVLFFSTRLDRGKGRSLVRDPYLVLSVINGAEPHSYVTVEGQVRMSDAPERRYVDQLAATEVRLGPMPGPAETIARMLSEPGRVVVLLAPSRVAGVVV